MGAVGDPLLSYIHKMSVWRGTTKKRKEKKLKRCMHIRYKFVFTTPFPMIVYSPALEKEIDRSCLQTPSTSQKRENKNSTPMLI